MQEKLITLSHPSTGLEDLIQKANDLIRAAKAPSTRKAAYQSDFRIYDSWCTDHGLTSQLLKPSRSPLRPAWSPT
jgi:hypothetical protein